MPISAVCAICLSCVISIISSYLQLNKELWNLSNVLMHIWYNLELITWNLHICQVWQHNLSSRLSQFYNCDIWRNTTITTRQNHIYKLLSLVSVRWSIGQMDNDDPQVCENCPWVLSLPVPGQFEWHSDLYLSFSELKTNYSVLISSM